MKVCLIQEGVWGPGDKWDNRILENLAEAELADKCGFDVYALSEQHFAHGTACTSAPEIMLPAIAARTERIKLRIASINLLPYNHPIRTAEQILTLQILSKGRAELGGARSNNPYTLDAFGVDPQRTRQHRDEQLRILSQIFRTGQIEYESEFYSIPHRTITPWTPNGRKPPLVTLSASGVQSHEDAGEIGVGAMTGTSVLGWEYAAACVGAYKKAVADAVPLFDRITNRAGLFSVGVCCDKSRERAYELTRPGTLKFIKVILDYFLKLGDRSPDYAYFKRLNEIRERHEDIHFLIQETPYVNAGTPDDLIRHARKVYEMGYDEVIWRIDGLGHEHTKSSIELIGKHVLPELHAWPAHAGTGDE